MGMPMAAPTMVETIQMVPTATPTMVETAVPMMQPMQMGAPAFSAMPMMEGAMATPAPSPTPTPTNPCGTTASPSPAPTPAPTPGCDDKPADWKSTAGSTCADYVSKAWCTSDGG